MHLMLMLFAATNALPTPWTEDLDNSLNQDIEVLPKSKTTTAGPKDKIKYPEDSRVTFPFTDFITEGLLTEVSMLDDAVPKIKDFPVTEKLHGSEEFVTTTWQEQEISPLFTEDLLLSTEAIPSTTFNVSGNFFNDNVTDPIESVNETTTIKSKSIRNIIEEKEINNEVQEIEVTAVAEVTTTTQAIIKQQDEKESQEEEEESSEEEEEQDFVQSLVNSFLSGLSTPEGGVDVDAIVGLIGGLSVPKDDGTYDFSGLTETLQSFLGGDDQGGGGSDVGKFLGDLLAAIIQGSAKPPGAKGAGILAGNIFTGILPGLSAPPPPPPEGSDAKPEQGLDSAGFFQGLLKTILAGSSGGNNKNQTMANGWNKPMYNMNHAIFRSVFPIFSSILSKFSRPS